MFGLATGKVVVVGVAAREGACLRRAAVEVVVVVVAYWVLSPPYLRCGASDAPYVKWPVGGVVCLREIEHL